ncbi:MAG: hypothetical protein OXC81_07995 [Betaproteobacteria bacterium]|nr:hypothetical protein [Betaproteobacteria bacterium]
MGHLVYLRRLLLENAGKSALMWLTLMKIVVPILIAVRWLDIQFNFTSRIGQLLEPLMELVGLPGATGIAWAVGMFGQGFAGFLVLAAQWDQINLTVAQATVFALLMLQAHSLPVEVRIAQRLGAAVAITVITRLASAVAFAWLFNRICLAFDWLQQPARLLFAGDLQSAQNWLDWFGNQAASWLLLLPIIFVLSIGLQLLKDLRIERFLLIALSPVLRIAGINPQAGSLVAIGMVMGLSCGGALLIREVERGQTTRRDAFMSALLLGLCHSLIDDALFAALFGANLLGTLAYRFVMALLLMALLAWLIRRISLASVERWLMSRPT